MPNGEPCSHNLWSSPHLCRRGTWKSTCEKTQKTLSEKCNATYLQAETRTLKICPEASFLGVNKAQSDPHARPVLVCALSGDEYLSLCLFRSVLNSEWLQICGATLSERQPQGHYAWKFLPLILPPKRAAWRIEKHDMRVNGMITNRICQTSAQRLLSIETNKKTSESCGRYCSWYGYNDSIGAS